MNTTKRFPSDNKVLPTFSNVDEGCYYVRLILGKKVVESKECLDELDARRTAMDWLTRKRIRPQRLGEFAMISITMSQRGESPVALFVYNY